MLLPDETLTAHLTHLRLLGRSPNTTIARARVLTRLGTALGPVPLLEATHADLLAWRTGLAVTDTTVSAYTSHVRSFYEWAIGAGLIESNPAARIPVPPKRRRIPRPISEDDLLAALDRAPPRVRPWLVLAAWAGLRAQEIAFLQRQNILDTRQPPVLLVAADAAKGRRERVIPMSAFVKAELRAADLAPAGYIFRRFDGKPGPNAPWVISHLGNRALRESGTSATFHSLRHRFLTLAYQASHDLRLVQELAGHASIESTTGYVAYDQGGAVAAVEAIAAPKRLRVVGG